MDRPTERRSSGFIPISKSNAGQLGRSPNRLSNKRRRNKCSDGNNQLIARIKTLIKNRGDDDYLTNDSLICDLQKFHPEYRRKQRPVLERLVQKAVDAIDDDLNSEDGPVSDLEDDGRANNNLVNQSLNSLYSNASKYSESPQKKKRKKSKSEVDESKVDMKIDKALAKQTELRERYLVKSKTTFEDFGGIKNVIEKIKDTLIHLLHPEIFKQLGVRPARGILLYGPPGVGKTMLVEAIASHLDISYLRCDSTELIDGVSGESESKIRQLFNLAESMEPCLLFIDEIDAITPKREQASKEMEKRIVSQLAKSFDGLAESDDKRILVIGATNRLDCIDPSLRRARRFDEEIGLEIPDEESRLDILRVLCKNVIISGQISFEKIAHDTPGFVGSDFEDLIREAAKSASKRVLRDENLDYSMVKEPVDGEVLCKLGVEMSDFETAIKRVKPSAKREGFATIPDVTWDDVGALSDIKERLQLSILARVRHKNVVEVFGLPMSAGVLLCGPPGCGKTMLAKAIANESGINFMSVKGPELLNMYVGESERAIRRVFTQARDSKPCVIFFDEIDALCPKRTSSESGNSSARVVNQLLTEMDGLEDRGCFLLAATNRPDILDPAILRPGRFDKILFVGLPTPHDRVDILRALTKNGKKPPLDEDVDLSALGVDEKLDGFTGADLKSLVVEAASSVMKECIDGNLNPINERVHWKHFTEALTRVKQSVSTNERKKYDKLAERYKC